MDEEINFKSRSAASSPQDPLASLSDYALGSSGSSSWGSETSLLSNSINFRSSRDYYNNSSLSLPTDCCYTDGAVGVGNGSDDYEINWKQRCSKLQMNINALRRQSRRTKEFMSDKVCLSFLFILFQ